MSEVLGKLIAGRYRIDALIGSGGAGAVYRATQELLHRPVALKTLRPELANHPGIRRRFEREARAIASLHHPNIATVYDFGTDADASMYLAMEFVEGTSLAELVERENLPFGTLRRLFDQILAGLAHAHGRGVIHRDIKPANILIQVDDEGEPLAKIVDFGIATLADRARLDEQADGVVGTPHFMAPEQARGEAHLTPAVDLYTTGLMLYWATTGRHAFDGADAESVMRAQVEAPMPRPRWRDGLSVPEGLELLLRDALHKDPTERISTSGAFRERLRALAGGVLRTRVETTVPRGSARHPVASARRRTLLESVGHTLLSDQADAPPASPTTHTASTVPSTDSPATPIAAGQGARSAPPLVGRQEDRGLLIEAANRVLTEQKGLIVSLEGEAGLGKSRLARWLRDQVTEVSGYRAVEGAFHREGERGLRGIREALESLLRVRGLGRDRVLDTVSSRLREAGVDAPDDHRRITEFLRPGGNLEPDDGSGQRIEVLFDVLVRTVEALSTLQPLMILVDDLHFAGPETLALLEYLAAEMDRRAMRLLVVVTLQVGDAESAVVDQLSGRLARFEGNTVLRRRLAQLDRDQAERLVLSMIHATPELAQRIVDRAAGNPMHVVQLTRFLREESLIQWTPGGWQPAEGVDVMEVLPPSLADTLALRIEQVEASPETGARVHDLLDRLAILGMSVPFRILERMLELEGRQDLTLHVDPDLDLLLDEELLTMTEKRDDDILSFPTSLVRDVVLRRLRNRRTTRRLHALAAQAKLDAHGGAMEKIAAELVAHYAGARDRTSELQAARMVAEAAERNHRPHDAIEYYNRCLRILDDLPEQPDNAPAQRRSIHLRIGLLSVGFGEFESAAGAFRRVTADPGASAVERIVSELGLADLAWMQGRFDDAEQAAQSALELARELDHAEGRALRGRALLALARVAWHRGRLPRTEALVREAQQLMDDTDLAEHRAEVLWFMADLARGRGELAQAEELFQQSLGHFKALNHQRGIAKCEAKLAVTARMRNELDRAARRYRRALQIYERLGARRGVAHQLNGLGDVARFRGDTALATDHYRRAVEIFQQIGVPFDAAIALTNLGVVARDAGQFDAAEDAFQRALTVCEAVGYPYLILGVKLNLALNDALSGREERSRRLVEESLTLTAEVDLVDPDYAHPLERIGDLRRESGRIEEAETLYGHALTMWRELGRSTDAERVLAHLESMRTA